MIVRKKSLFPSAEEVNSIIQQTYEQLIVLLEGSGGDFTAGLIFHWSDEKIVNRVRTLHERIETVMRNRPRPRAYDRWLSEYNINHLPSFSTEVKLAAQAFFQRTQIDSMDVVVYREFQSFKLKAIKLFQENYERILSNVGDDPNAASKMLKVLEFVSKEKLAIAGLLG